MRLEEPERVTKHPFEEESDLMAKRSSSGAEEPTPTEAKGFQLDAEDAPAEPLKRGFMPVLKNRNF